MEYQQPKMPKYECLLFDLDDTLYPLSSEYMVQRLGIEETRVRDMNQLLYKNYGTSMAGLRAIGYNFDNDDYHRLPYEVLRPDYVLRSLLLSLPYRKLIFSNGDKVHVAKTLVKLGLKDCFEGVICFETLNPTSNSEDSHFRSGCREFFDHSSLFDAGSELPVTPIICKPFANAFEDSFQQANINHERTLFFDDSIRNIQVGKDMGLNTVLVGTSQVTRGADYAVESIHNIREAIPGLFEVENKKMNIQKFSDILAVEASVIA